MGFCSYGPIAIFGVVANECVPSSIAGTAYAIASIFANSKFTLYKGKISFPLEFFLLERLTNV